MSKGRTSLMRSSISLTQTTTGKFHCKSLSLYFVEMRWSKLTLKSEKNLGFAKLKPKRKSWTTTTSVKMSLESLKKLTRQSQL